MNKYISKLFGVMFQSRQTRQVIYVPLQHPPTSSEEWRQHWQSQGQPWRTEPEIDAKRQTELTQRRTVVPNTEEGIYPFKGIKLNRADIEWLLATHENGRGPVDWHDTEQREREGLDLRGADLRHVDLKSLPLARLRGGLTMQESVVKLNDQQDYEKTRRQGAEAAVLLEEANLFTTHLEGADLFMAQMERAKMQGTHLEDAHLAMTQMKGADLSGVHANHASFGAAHLDESSFFMAWLEEADLSSTCLENANLFGAHLGKAMLIRAQLKGTNLKRAHLEGAVLDNIMLGGEHGVGPQLADVQWGDTNLTVIKWSQVNRLGDEYEARQKKRAGKVKEKSVRIEEYEGAVRANRQLAVVLQNQGLDEDANRFAYRAQILQRKLLWKQRNFWKWLGSMILALLAGYGYRMWRIIVAYLIIVLLCAVAYYVLGIYYEPHLSFLEAVLTSITAFHGRVFSEPFLQSGEPQLWVTAFEAVAGLVIEGVFIAMLTQKFFGK